MQESCNKRGISIRFAISSWLLLALRALTWDKSDPGRGAKGNPAEVVGFRQIWWPPRLSTYIIVVAFFYCLDEIFTVQAKYSAGFAVAIYAMAAGCVIRNFFE